MLCDIMSLLSTYSLLVSAQRRSLFSTMQTSPSHMQLEHFSHPRDFQGMYQIMYNHTHNFKEAAVLDSRFLAEDTVDD